MSSNPPEEGTMESTEAAPRRPTVARIANQGQTPVLHTPPDAVYPSDRANGQVEVRESDEDKLDRIFSAKATRPRAEEEIYIKSLSMTITIRELTQRELDDIFEMFEDRANPRAKGRKRPISAINAFLVARAIVSPDFGSEKAKKGLHDLYGTAIFAEALPQIFKPLEVTAIAERVLALSGGDEDAITVAENL